MGEGLGAEERELDLGGADTQRQAALGLEGWAAVHGETKLRAVFAADLQFGLAVEDDRAVREGVGADRGQDDHGGGGVHERTARGQVVGGGAGGRGEDQAIGAVLVHTGAVGPHGEAAHAEDIARLQDDVIESEREAAVGEADFQERTVFTAKIAGED